jgi:hypothetical protein
MDDPGSPTRRNAANGGRRSSRPRDAGEPIALTERDRELFSFLHAARLATTAQLRVAVGHLFTLRGLPRRLAQLTEARFLERPPARQLPRRGFGPPPVAYALGARGKDALFGTWRPERREAVKAGDFLPVEHELLISHVHAVLRRACRTFAGGQRVRLEHWAQGDAALLRDETKNPVEVLGRPDARFTISDASDDTESWFFLEADTGSMPHARMREKFTRYRRWTERRCFEQLGADGVRVATITTSPGRRDNLRDTARAVDDAAGGHYGALYWFASLTDFAEDPERFFGPIWIHAGDHGHRHTLLEG